MLYIKEQAITKIMNDYLQEDKQLIILDALRRAFDAGRSYECKKMFEIDHEIQNDRKDSV